ncbi:MAPEG family protein [Sphingomonas sp.]|uniref:MAPEG family protein n=1 Tax=Sphingomonas sp. TaxID=28214 RepID=UPI0025EBBCB3|nr:MAPEG family protein [Sphingomonas sp.]MBV9528688.1 MAPEG family protein [Sphingomonas sp.]
MPISPLLGPVVALVAWTLLMLVWMAVKRAPMLRGRNIPDGGRGVDLERAVPGKAHWPAHNYIHLMEQPTIFYAIVFALILMRFDAPINVYLAWGYVAFRVLHSIVQATTNVVRVRFALFALSTLCVVGLTTHAGLRIILGH